MSDETKQGIAQRLREARRMAGLTQGQVAKLMDLHRPSVSEIEAGNRNVMAAELARFGELYDVSLEWLTGRLSTSGERRDTQLELAARQLAKLKAADLERLLTILAAMRDPGRLS